MIFNSLGSNYSFEFVLKALFASNNSKYEKELSILLSEKYRGKTILLYKGREAIKLALDITKLPEGSRVGVTGFTCYAVYKAIVDAGLKPVYLDIDRSLNFSFETLRKNKDLKVLIVQNTLGSPCDMGNIKDFCKKHNILLIEDLAHSVGTVYQNGIEAGLFGDFVALSFSQDKMIDSVSGGALVIRNKKYQKLADEIGYEKLDLKIQLKDKFYPLLTFLIRKLYPLGVGKVLHLVFKKFSFLSQPIADIENIKFHKLPGWYCYLASFRFLRLDKDLRHRQEIASIYAKDLKKKILSRSSNIRFPIFVGDRDKLIEYLKKYGIYVSDIWYDAPVSPRRYLKLTDYDKGECPKSEKVSEKIVNLPTHINVTAKDAKFISKKVNQWIRSQ